MAQIEYKCDSCGAAVRAEVDESGFTGNLRWYLSYRCSKCGASVEADDTGFPPADIRQAIIQIDGLWEVEIDGEQSGRTAVVRALRRILGWSLAEAAQKLKSGSGSMFSGTKVEAEWLQGQLSNETSSRVVVRRN